jgi:hypothetical protein
MMARLSNLKRSSLNTLWGSRTCCPERYKGDGAAGELIPTVLGLIPLEATGLRYHDKE